MSSSRSNARRKACTQYRLSPPETDNGSDAAAGPCSTEELDASVSWTPAAWKQRFSLPSQLSPEEQSNIRNKAVIGLRCQLHGLGAARRRAHPCHTPCVRVRRKPLTLEPARSPGFWRHSLANRDFCMIRSHREAGHDAGESRSRPHQIGPDRGTRAGQTSTAPHLLS